MKGHWVLFKIPLIYLCVKIVCCFLKVHDKVSRTMVKDPIILNHKPLLNGDFEFLGRQHRSSSEVCAFHYLCMNSSSYSMHSCASQHWYKAPHYHHLNLILFVPYDGRTYPCRHPLIAYHYRRSSATLLVLQRYIDCLHQVFLDASVRVCFWGFWAIARCTGSPSSRLSVFPVLLHCLLLMVVLIGWPDLIYMHYINISVGNHLRRIHPQNSP